MSKKHKYIIATTGTSIAHMFNKELHTPALQQEGYDSPALQHWKGKIQAELDSLRRLHKGDVRAFLSACSTETDSLQDMGLGAGDSVLLLVPDNMPGRLCAEAVRDVLCHDMGLGEAGVTLKQVEDLQMQDARRLGESGLPNLYETVKGVLEEECNIYSQEVCINPTGGDAALTPILTFLGNMYGCRTVYKCEHTGTLIDLPSIPITFDRGLFRRASTAIAQGVYKTPHEFFSKIEDFDPEEQPLFMSFLQRIGEEYIVSPLVYAFLDSTLKEEPLYISTKVAKQLNAMSEAERYEAETIFHKAACARLLQTKLHTVQENDLLVVKTPATKMRLCGYMEGESFRVAYFFPSHDDYMRGQAKYDKATARQLKYVLWSPLPPRPSHAGRTEVRDLHKKLEKSTAELGKYKQRATQAEAGMRRLDMRLKELSKRYDSLLRKNKELQTATATVADRLEACACFLQEPPPLIMEG